MDYPAKPTKKNINILTQFYNATCFAMADFVPPLQKPDTTKYGRILRNTISQERAKETQHLFVSKSGISY